MRWQEQAASLYRFLNVDDINTEGRGRGQGNMFNTVILIAWRSESASSPPILNRLKATPVKIIKPKERRVSYM